MSYTKCNECQISGSANLELILSLGLIPLVNTMSKIEIYEGEGFSIPDRSKKFQNPLSTNIIENLSKCFRELIHTYTLGFYHSDLGPKDISLVSKKLGLDRRAGGGSRS